MSTPLNRVAKTLMDLEPPWLTDDETDDWHSPAREVLLAALDVDELVGLLELHSEEYDADCSIHHGCKCDPAPKTEVSYKGFLAARAGYRYHLASVIRAHLLNKEEIS